jgi:ribosome maturation factor RimP
LRTAAHFERYKSERARISLVSGIDGRRNFTGVLLGVDSSLHNDGDNELDPVVVVVVDVDGTEFRLPLHDIANAKLIPDWNRLTAN